MRLIYIANIRIPSEKAHTFQILRMCEAFKNNNINTELITPFRIQTTKRLSNIKNIFNYYRINKLKIIKLPSIDLIWLDLHTKRFSSLRFIIQACSFAFFASIYCLFKNKYIFYTRDRYFVLFFGLFRILLNRKLFYESHNFEPIIVKANNLGLIDGIVCITNSLKKRYVQSGIKNYKILVAPDGVDISFFHRHPESSFIDARKELGLPLDKKIICYSGHLYNWKGSEILALSTRYFPSSWMLCIIGGTEKDEIKFNDFLKINKINSIIFRGFVNPNLVPIYLLASDVVVLPNIDLPSSNYTSPLKLFEYMASEKPIVATDLAPIREILNDDNSIIVKPGDPYALAEGIKKVLDNEQLAKEISHQAYIDVQQYKWDIRAQRIMNFISARIDSDRN